MDRSRRILAATGRRPSDKRLAKAAAVRAMHAPRPGVIGPGGSALVKKPAKKSAAKTKVRPAPKKGNPRGKGKKKR
jgi:hypothetical protein